MHNALPLAQKRFSTVCLYRTPPPPRAHTLVLFRPSYQNFLFFMTYSTLLKNGAFSSVLPLRWGKTGPLPGPPLAPLRFFTHFLKVLDDMKYLMSRWGQNDEQIQEVSNFLQLS